MHDTSAAFLTVMQGCAKRGSVLLGFVPGDKEHCLVHSYSASRHFYTHAVSLLQL